MDSWAKTLENYVPWSLSQYNLYKKCPTAFKFRVVERRPDPAGPAAARGTDIHAQLEGYLQTGIWGGNIREFTRNKAEVMRELGYRPELRLALDKDWKVVDWKEPTAWVRAVIDAFVCVEGMIDMGEWKTGQVYDDHVNQRRLYLCMALSAFTSAEAAKIETIYADQDHAQSSELSRKGLAAEQAYWKDAVVPMLTDTFFSPRPGGHCRWCAFSRDKGGPCVAG
jgi:hypothetical protein